jgi:hypothetical protein
MLIGILQHGLLSYLTQVKQLQSAELVHAAWQSSEWVTLLPDPGETVTIC